MATSHIEEAWQQLAAEWADKLDPDIQERLRMAFYGGVNWALASTDDYNELSSECVTFFTEQSAKIFPTSGSS